MNETHERRLNINTNTGIGISIVIAVVLATIAIMNGIGGIKSDINATQAKNESNKSDLSAQIASLKAEFTGRADKMEMKINALEANKSSVTALEFLQWTIHLQQLNNDPKQLQIQGLKVPEAKVDAK